MKQEYDMNPEFALKIKMMSAVPFVSTDYVEAYFRKLCDDDIFTTSTQ